MLEAGVRNGKLVAVITLIVCVLGIAGALRIPVQMIPDLDVRTISVITTWAGATPQDMEKEILIEQERYLRNLPNLLRMESLAETGRATIELEFPFGVDVNEALIRVANALNQVPDYPENVDQPQLLSSSFSENAFLYFTLIPAPGNPLALDMDMVTDFTEDHVRPRLERVAGVSQVELRGGAERQVQVIVDPSRLAQRGIGLIELRNALRSRNSDSSAGDLDEGRQRYLMRVTGRFGSLSELEGLIIGRSNGTDIRLRDVAEVRMDHFEVRNRAYANGARSINLAVKREPGSNVIAIKEAMMAEVADLNRDLLAANGLQLILIGDDVRYVQSSVRGVFTSLLLGAALATAVLFLFLRSPAATGIGLLGIPVCTISAFLGLILFDRTINVISLAGVAFAIGMTLDNTIVVLESIEQARRRGLDAIEAAIAGVREVWAAVLASTATTVLVFAPVLFIAEEAGQIYSDIAIAISGAILASMLFAVLVVPALTVHLGLGGIKAADGRLVGGILATVDWLDQRPSRRRGCLALTVALTLGLGWLLMPPAEYLPEGEEPKAFTRMIAPPGYNMTEMQRIADGILPLLAAAREADPREFHRGEAPLPALSYYYLQVAPGALWVMSEPKVEDDIGAMMNALTDLMSAYPGMRSWSHRGSIISSNQGGTRSVNLDFAGTDVGALYDSANHALRRAETLFVDPQISSEPPALSLDQPLMQIVPRWERLSELGFSGDEFGFTVAALSDGAFVDEFFLDDDKVDIFLFSAAGQAQTLEGLADLPVHTPAGEILPLAALADLHETVDSNMLRRVNGRRTVTLSVVPPRNVALETAVARVREELIPAMRAAGEITQGVSVTVSGAADQLDATRASLTGNFAIALVLIYLLLVAVFAHWGLPLIILATVPLGLASGVASLAAANGLGQLASMLGLSGWHQSFDMITMLGFLILLGTVVNNPILIVDHARQNLHAGSMTVRQAVRDAVASRVRPILMSSATTVFGLAPLVFSPAAGTELYRGLGIVVMTGILWSTVVTLTFLPCLLVAVFDLANRMDPQGRRILRSPSAGNP